MRETGEGIIMCPNVESAVSKTKQIPIHLTGIMLNRVLYEIATS